mgnify:FL=1
MFYSEILRIIEAGLDRDKDKVKNYALLLSKKLADDGDLKSSKRIVVLMIQPTAQKIEKRKKWQKKHM